MAAEGFVPQVGRLLRVGLEIVQFGVVEAVGGDQLVAVVAVHGGPAGRVAARLLGQAHIQGVAVFASYVVAVARWVGVAGQLHQAVGHNALLEAARPGHDQRHAHRPS